VRKNLYHWILLLNPFCSCETWYWLSRVYCNFFWYREFICFFSWHRGFTRICSKYRGFICFFSWFRGFISFYLDISVVYPYKPPIWRGKFDKPPVLGSQIFPPLMWTYPDGARLLRRVAPRCRAPHLTTRVFGDSAISPFLGGSIPLSLVSILGCDTGVSGGLDACGVGRVGKNVAYCVDVIFGAATVRCSAGAAAVCQVMNSGSSDVVSSSLVEGATVSSNCTEMIAHPTPLLPPPPPPHLGS